MSERPADYLSEALPVSVPAVAVAERVELYDASQCYYCGEPAGTVDHVIPRSMLQALTILGDDDVNAVLIRFNRRLTVPACLECNVVLSNSYQDTLAKRKEELKRRLRRRYQKLLQTPDWTDRELGELRGRLRDAVISALFKRDIVLRRLRY